MPRLKPILLILAVGLIAYLPVWHNGFVWDDDTMVANNPLVHAPDGILRMWTTTEQPDYWPVSLSTFWVEWRLWGLNPAGYHATNLALHLLEAVLLWTLLRRLGIPGALLAALLFVAHPVNVNSVGWIAERKNLMAMLFFLTSIHLFLRSALFRRARLEEVLTDPSEPPRRPPGSTARKGGLRAAIPNPASVGPEGTSSDGPDRWYGLSLLAFALAMLSKASVAPLPLVLLGLMAWRRRVRLREILLLLPFAAVAAALVGVNLWFQTRGFSTAIREVGWLERILGAGAVVWFYLYKAVLPLHLSFVYAPWHIRPGDPLWWLPLAGALAFTAALWRLSRPALFGWLYFCVMLLPAMGLTDVYFMRYSLVANHYQHLALIGVVAWAGAAWSGWRLDERWKRLAAGAVVAALVALTWSRNQAFRDSGTLFRATLKEDPQAWLAYNGLGLIAAKEGRTAEARDDFERAVQLDPNFSEAYLNLGASERAAGRIPEAVADFRRAIALNPDLPAGYFNLGEIELASGRAADAEADLRRALRLDPGLAEGYLNLGSLELAAGRFPEARADLGRAVRLDPGLAAGYLDLAALAFATGHPGDAVPLCQKALALRPAYPQAYYTLGNALQSLGRYPAAAEAFEAELRLQPNDSEGENCLGTAYRAMGQNGEALVHFQRALEIDPRNADARSNFEMALRP